MQTKKIFIATGNPSKLKDFTELFSWIDSDLEVKMVPEKIEVEENAATIAENSRLKVLPYKGMYNFPVIANDFGLEFDGKIEELLDKSKVKRQALNGKEEPDLSQEEIGSMMYNFYRKIARKYGGKIECTAHDTFSMMTPEGEVKQAHSIRDYELVDRSVKEYDIFHPLNSLRFSVSLQKYIDEFTDEEEKTDKKPLIIALEKLIQ